MVRFRRGLVVGLVRIELDSIMLIFIYPDVMKAGVWRLFEDIHNPEL